MDKREFYKELMSEYSFDKEKIYANAKKGKMAGRKPLPIYIGMTAAAAAVIVAVSGVTLAVNGNNSSGAVISPNSGVSLMELTPEERIRKALSELQQNENSNEMYDVLVTFKSPLAAPQAHGVLASNSNVLIKMLIMEDDSRITDKDAVAAVFNGSTAKIRGAVVNCPGYQMTAINNSEFVELVETLTEEDLASISTIKPVEPDNTSKPVDNGNTSTDTPDTPVVDIDDIPLVVDPDTSNGGESTGNDTSSQPEQSTKPVDPVNPDPVQPEQPDTPNVPVQPEKPTVAVPKLPEGIVLPTVAADKFAYITDDIGAERAYFMTDSVFFVKTKDALRLYKWNGEVEKLAVEQKAADVKTCWISENGSRMMVSAVEDGVRRKLYIIDANNCTINDMKVEEITGDGAIQSAHYNESLDIFALSVSLDESTDIYTASLSGYQPANATLVASGLENATLLAAANGTVYFSNMSGANTTLYRYSNGSVTEVIKLDGASAAVSNTAFTHAMIITTNGSFVFDPAVETLISVQSEKAVSFGVSAHSFSCDGGYFTVSGGQLKPTDSIAVIAKIDFMRSFSSKYAAVISNGSVRIVPSVYSSEVMNEGVTFVQPVENASAQVRATVNSAVGVINALADGKLAESGINSADKLNGAINACFTSAAADELKKLCGITDASLAVNSARLNAITIADTVLAMENDAQGTLYVKAGTFDGNAAYTAIPVKLANVDGTLKVDCVIK